MRRIIPVVLAAVLFAVPSFAAKKPPLDSDVIAAEAKREMETILELWREGKLNELYARTHTGAGKSKERFLDSLESAARKPACCWQKLQEVTVKVKDAATVDLHGRFGLEESDGSVTFSTTKVRMVWEEGWKANTSDLLALSGGKTKKKGKKKHATYRSVNSL